MKKTSSSLILAGTFVTFVLWSMFLFSPVIRNNTRSQEAVESRSAEQQKRQFNSNDLIWSDESGDWVLNDSNGDASLVFTGQPDPESCVWPDQRLCEQSPRGDRIINQLKLTRSEQSKTFKIAVAGDTSNPLGQELFLNDDCPVNRCEITDELSLADVIVFPNSDVRNELPKEVRTRQIWIAYLLESPPNTFDRRFSRSYRGHHSFNWTATYRSDSDIVTPYAKFVPYLSGGSRNSTNVDALYDQASEEVRMAIRNKKTRVAWFVSNCHAKNNRLEFARQLAKFIPVDIYGKCGNLTCHKRDKARCLKQINRDYKFYLAFENSNDRDYITEKLYENALGYNDKGHLLVPIVMGPPPEDYQRLAPPNSFIHVDNYRTAAELAKYLHHLGNNDALYYSYFRWKTEGEFVDTKFMCRVCAMAHKSHLDQSVRTIPNIRDWWLNQ